MDIWLIIYDCPLLYSRLPDTGDPNKGLKVKVGSLLAELLAVVTPGAVRNTNVYNNIKEHYYVFKYVIF